MTSNIEGLVREGKAAFRAGRKDEALKLLTRATELDERNEEAWLWLSAVVDNVENQQICLENVLAINPNNTKALKGLEEIEKKLSGRQTPPPSVLPPPPVQPPAQQSHDPFGAPPPQGGFHGSGHNVDLPSAEEYDAWVDGLNLGAEDLVSPGAAPASDPFGFESGPFQEQAGLAESPDAGESAGYEDYDRFGGYDDVLSPAQSYEAPPSSPALDPYAIPQTSTYGSSYGDSYDEPDAFAHLEDLGAADGGDFASADPFSTGAATTYTENGFQQYWNYIPAEIKATHLPGQGPAYPRWLLVGLAAVSGGIVIALITMIALLVEG